jgi:hypothetical protein
VDLEDREPRRADGRHRGRRAVRVAVPLVVFLFLIFIRTRGISQMFLLLGDQILYWRMALGSWRELPIGGGPSSVGGTTIGPVFCWVMWAIRHAVGPWTQNLPHAGGIGLSIVQSAADGFLLAAIWKRFDSLALALAVTLFIATAPFDMALSASIWNPPLAVALVKITIALALLSKSGGSIWWSAGATASALLAVQAHSSAVFFAAPVIASFTARELLARRWGPALQVAAASAAVILVLEVPFLLHLAMRPDEGASPPVVVKSVSYTLAHPQLLRLADAARALTDACRYILLRPWTFSWLGTLLTICAAVTAYRTRSDVTLAGVTVVSLICTIAGFAFWQFDFQHYWFLTIAPSAALTIALALTAWRPAAPFVAVLLAAIVLWTLPSRIADAMTLNRLPEYAALVRGSREILRQAPQVRSIDAEFALPPSTDTGFLYEVLGGRVTADAPVTATIGRTGQGIVKPAPSDTGTGRPR